MDGQECQIMLEDLPTEIILHIFSFLRIPDLVRVQKVSRRFAKLVLRNDENDCNLIWANASSEGVAVNQKTISSLERGARCGNTEALIKLVVAYLYSEGVPDGEGRGTELAENGLKASEYIMKLESLSTMRHPFSWVLIRPPFSKNFVCCKACVWNRLKTCCIKNEACCSNFYYVVGKALSFHEEMAECESALEWFKNGSEQGSITCSYEYWKAVHKNKISQADITGIRLLRQITKDGQIMDAKFELCRQYAVGHYGGLSKPLAMSYIKQIMSTSPPLLADKVFKVQHKINKYMMHVLIDWIIEVSEMKSFSSRTVHLAIQLIQRYLLQRCLSRSKVQLLGITALLVAARWTDSIILTIREAASITDDTYTYQEVVNTMADLMAALKGNMICPLPTDYMEILHLISSSESKTIHLASYIAESCVIHSDFGGLDTSHYSAACVLLSRILSSQDFPWSNDLIITTGMNVSDLKNTVLLLYKKCFTNDIVIDYRGEKLNAIHSRYAEDRYHGVSETQVMSLNELKELLGVSPPTPVITAPKQKLFSFLSDSQYRSDDDSIVDQSFIQDFDSHFISEPSSLLVQQSSPLSSASLPPKSLPFSDDSSASPITSTHSNDCVSPITSTHSNGCASPITSTHSCASPITSTHSNGCVSPITSTHSNGCASPITSTHSCASPITSPHSNGCVSTTGLSSSTTEGSCSSSMRPPLIGIVPLFSEETVSYDSNVKLSSNKKNKKKNAASNKENSDITRCVKKINRPLTGLDNTNNIRNIHLFEKRSNNDTTDITSKRHRSS